MTTIDTLKQYPLWTGGNYPDKIPLNPHTGGNAQSNNPKTFGTYAQAETAKKHYGWDLIGFAFVPEVVEIMGIDIDKCVDENGIIEPWAMAIISRIDSYAEFSPSGRGVHILCYGALPKNIKANDAPETCEMYDRLRWFTVTGAHVPGTPTTIERRYRQVLDLHADVLQRIEAHKRPKPQPVMMQSVTGDRAERYGQSALAGELDALAAAREGSRNEQLFKSTAALRELANAGALDWQTVENALTNTALAIGLDENETVKTIESAKKRVNGHIRDKMPDFSLPTTEKPGPAADSGKSGKMEASEKPKTPTHDELADRWTAAHNHTCFGLGDWRRYEAGLWPAVSDLTIKAEVKRILIKAKTEGVRPTASLVSSVTELAKLDIFRDSDIFDADADLLVCKNGTLHIPTMGLRPHSPDNYATTGVSYAYDPKAKAPYWTAFLMDISTRISQGVVDFLQEFAGYALTTDTSHEVAVWLYGPPGSGKSTFLEGLEAMLCGRAGVLGLAEVERSRFALGNLPGKTLVISTEQPGMFLASTHILNALISGETITVEAKFKDPIDITPRAKIAWAMNELPRVSDPNSGLFRRVKVVEFPVIPEPERDPTLKEAIKTEGAGILNWALEGLARLNQRGRFDIPAEIITATDNFKNTNDIPKSFVEDCCVTGYDVNQEPYRAQSGQLYNAYKDWCIETGHKPQSSTGIANHWKRLGFEKYLAAGQSYWRYVGLRAGF